MSVAPLYIGADEVRRLLKPSELIVPLEEVMAEFSRSTTIVDELEQDKNVEGGGRGERKGGEEEKEGGVLQPVRTVLDIEQHNGFFALMPGYIPSHNAMASKLITFYPGNTDRPTHQAWITLFEPTNGSLLAILDGNCVTAIRTGVASAIATKYLSDPNSSVLAILGSGVQARSHFAALSCVRSFKEVRIWSRTLLNAQRFAEEIGANACSTAEEAVHDADVICTVTFATTPIVLKEWVKPGAHINAVGACRPDWQEIDPALMCASTVYCDSREACLKESGDVILSQCDVYAEIGEVVGGQKEALWKQTTVYESLGMAVEDVISAKFIYQKYVDEMNQKK